MKLRLALICSLGLTTCSIARGQILVDHPPHHTGGLASDTLFLDDFNHEFSQRVADNFMLTAPAEIGRIGFWGFYHLDNPPSTETMRIRFYDARPSDGLPGAILFEETFLSPQRTATGEVVVTGILPNEYYYQIDLPSSFSVNAKTPYWLEIVQVGDLQTHFRWEFSLSELNGQAFINPITGDWLLTQSIVSGTAFQLIAIPEPHAIWLFAFAFFITRRRI